MNRLQKKCLVGSMAMHGLLILIVILVPAFLPKEKSVDAMPVLDIISSKLIDDALSGGGNPDIKEAVIPKNLAPAPIPAPTPNPPTPTPAPPKVEPTPIPPTPEPKVEPVKPTVKPVPVKPKEPEPVPEPAPKKTSPLDRVKVDVSKPVTRNRASDEAVKKAAARAAQKNAEEEAAAAANERREIAKAAGSQVSQSLQALTKGLSSGTTVQMPGPGGEFYANWAQTVKSIYEHSWIQPEDATSDSVTVQVEVTIARDGSIIRSATRIVRKSGTVALDKSVQRVLDLVDRVPPFPESAKDSRRILNIIFKLKSKNSIG